MKKRGKGMTLFKMWQKQMKQKAKKWKKKTRFWKYKRRRKKQETRLPIFKMQQMQIKRKQKRKEKNFFLKIKKIRKRGCRFSKCNQHLRPLLLLHAIKELQSQQKHRNATLFFFINTSMIKHKRNTETLMLNFRKSLPFYWPRSNHSLPNQTYQIKPNHTYHNKPTKPNLPNQTWQTKSTKSNSWFG